MQVIANAEMAELIRSCLPELDEIEAAYIRDCYLLEPTTPLGEFSRQWHLSTKAAKELRTQVLLRLKELMAKKGINSLWDIV